MICTSHFNIEKPCTPPTANLIILHNSHDNQQFFIFVIDTQGFLLCLKCSFKYYLNNLRFQGVNTSHNDLTPSAAVNWASAASMQFILMAYKPRSVCSCGRCVRRSRGCCWHRPQACEISLKANDLFPITSRHIIMCSNSISWNTDRIGLLSTTETQEHQPT